MEFEVGQEVLVSYRYNQCLSKVKSITPKGNVRCENGRLYTPSGSEKGNSFDRTTITNDDEEIRYYIMKRDMDIAKNKIVDKLEKNVYSKEILEQILGLLGEEQHD